MTPFPSMPRGLWFDEFEPGQQVETDGRTLTEADIINFASLSGDFSPVHVDAEFSRKGPFGQRVAHGLLVVSLVSGLLIQTGLLDGTLSAFREISRWKFKQPVFIGDTIRVVFLIEEVRPLKGRKDGLVTIGLRVKNQRDQIVMMGQWVTLVLGRPE